MQPTLTCALRIGAETVTLLESVTVTLLETGSFLVCLCVYVQVSFLPAGKLTVKCIKAKDLTPPVNKMVDGSSAVRMDPYVSLIMDGQAARVVKRSTTDKDGGSDPVWDCDLEFDVVDQYLIDVEVYDQDISGTDILLGITQISLLPVFKAGASNIWLTLRLRRDGVGVKETGDVNFGLTFSGPPNIAYPQYRQDIDSFDDSLRTFNLEKMIDASAEGKGTGADAKSGSAVPSAIGAAEKLVSDMITVANDNGPSAEFSEDEIVAAFRFIDLDHNNFVGAAEIRHILVCMGELITDEEIDMMISMVDLDGDGQVSFHEFRTLVLHPNPGEMDLHRDVLLEKEKLKSEEKVLTAGKAKGKEIDAMTYQRQKEMNLRDSKKKMLTAFVIDNDLDFNSVLRMAAALGELPKERKVNGLSNFETFCKLARVEPIGEYLKLFGLFDPEEQGYIDFKEFLLSLMNFVPVEREDRVTLSFKLYDEQKTGFISQKEVIEILKGNHMLGMATVQRKAQTIMKQAAANEAGAITLQEFIVVTKKFPNIMLPTFHKTGVNTEAAGNGEALVIA